MLLPFVSHGTGNLKVGKMGFIVLDMMHLDILEECFLYNSSCTNGTYKNIKKNYRYLTDPFCVRII